MTFPFPFPFPFPSLDTSFPSQGEFPVIVELDETQLAAAAGGRACGGSGGKVGEVPVVTG